MKRGWTRAALVLLSLGAAFTIPLILALRAGVPLSDLLRLPWQAHLAGAIVLAVEVGARAGRLLALARPLGVPLRPTNALLAQVSADAAGAVTPARSGSEPAKLLAMRRDGGGIGGAGAIALGEMAFEVAGLVLVAGLFALTLPQGTRAALAVVTYALVVATALTLLYRVAGRGGETPPAWLARLGLGGDRWRRLVESAAEFRERARALPRMGNRAATATAAFTLLHQIAKATTFPALAWGTWVAGGFEATGGAGGGAGTMAEELGGLPWATLFVVPFSILYLGALLPPPGGGGGVELGFAALLGDALPPSALPVLLLWWRAYTHYVSALVGALCMAVLVMRRRVRGRDRPIAPGTAPGRRGRGGDPSP